MILVDAFEAEMKIISTGRKSYTGVNNDAARIWGRRKSRDVAETTSGRRNGDDVKDSFMEIEIRGKSRNRIKRARARASMKRNRKIRKDARRTIRRRGGARDGKAG